MNTRKSAYDFVALHKNADWSWTPVWQAGYKRQLQAHPQEFADQVLARMINEGAPQAAWKVIRAATPPSCWLPPNSPSLENIWKNSVTNAFTDLDLLETAQCGISLHGSYRAIFRLLVSSAAPCAALGQSLMKNPIVLNNGVHAAVAAEAIGAACSNPAVWNHVNVKELLKTPEDLVQMMHQLHTTRTPKASAILAMLAYNDAPALSQIAVLMAQSTPTLIASQNDAHATAVLAASTTSKLEAVTKTLLAQYDPLFEHLNVRDMHTVLSLLPPQVIPSQGVLRAHLDNAVLSAHLKSSPPPAPKATPHKM